VARVLRQLAALVNIFYMILEVQQSNSIALENLPFRIE
jgi:hypothetical protein